MRSSGRSWLIAALASGLAVGAFGCAFLLDTDKLQEGTGPGTGGAAGEAADAAPEADAGFEDSAAADVTQEPKAAVPCQSDFDCLQAGGGDLCFAHRCDLTTKTCEQPTPWDGPVVRENPDGPVTITSGKDKLGVPALLLDGEHLYVAAWFETNGVQNVLLQKYSPQQAVRTSTFNELISGYTKVAATPGLMIEQSPSKRLALLVPAEMLGNNLVCMRRLWVGPDLEKPDMLPQICYGPLSNYTADPTRTAPRLQRRSPTEDDAMWLQEGNLVIKQGIAPAQTVDFNGEAKSFSPLLGQAKVVGAIVESGATPQTEETYEWYTGKPGFGGLFTAQAGPRLGTSSAALPTPTATFNLVAWARPTPSSDSQVGFFEESCDEKGCSAATTQPIGGQAADVTFAPALAVRPSSALSVDFAISVVYSGQDTSGTYSVLTTQFARTVGKVASIINPGFAYLASAESVQPVGLPERPLLLGRTASVITANGTVYVVWVQKLNGKEAMLMRSYRIVDNCTAP